MATGFGADEDEQWWESRHDRSSPEYHLGDCERFTEGSHRRSITVHWRRSYDEDLLDYFARDLACRRDRRTDTRTTALPINAGGIFGFLLSVGNCESFVGDLEERYRGVLSKQGHASAAIWFWRQVVASLGPLSWAAVKRLFGVMTLRALRRKGRSQ